MILDANGGQMHQQATPELFNLLVVDFVEILLLSIMPSLHVLDTFVNITKLTFPK